MTKRKALLASTLLAASLAFASGCHKKGPAEEAGSKVDDAVQKMKDAVNPPGPAEKAGRKIDKALDND